jgi:predicted kinase
MGDRIIARFTKNGCGYDPRSRECLPRGTNVIHHPVFWDVSRERAKAIATEHGANLVVCD